MRKYSSEWLKGARGDAKRSAPTGRAPAQAHNDADEAMEDARAETRIDDTTAALDAGESAGESSGAAEPALPPALLQRRLDKARSVAEPAIKEKEAMQNKMDEMKAELELAKSNLGDTVQVAHIIPFLPPPARYVWFRLNLVKFRFVRHVPDSISPHRQNFRRKQWQLPQF